MTGLIWLLTLRLKAVNQVAECKHLGCHVRSPIEYGSIVY